MEFNIFIITFNTSIYISSLTSIYLSIDTSMYYGNWVPKLHVFKSIRPFLQVLFRRSYMGGVQQSSSVAQHVQMSRILCSDFIPSIRTPTVQTAEMLLNKYIQV